MSLGREALRQYREGQAAPAAEPDTLSQIPACGEFDEEEALTVWNGRRWVTWEKWRAATPVLADDPPDSDKSSPRTQAAPAAASTPRCSDDQKGLW